MKANFTHNLKTHFEGNKGSDTSLQHFQRV